MKHRNLNAFALLCLVFATVALLMNCGADDKDTAEESRPKPAEHTIPSSWDGLSDWTESEWKLEDE